VREAVPAPVAAADTSAMSAKASRPSARMEKGYPAPVGANADLTLCEQTAPGALDTVTACTRRRVGG
jgi:hypothetical protein